MEIEKITGRVTTHTVWEWKFEPYKCCTLQTRTKNPPSGPCGGFISRGILRTHSPYLRLGDLFLIVPSNGKYKEFILSKSFSSHSLLPS